MFWPIDILGGYRARLNLHSVHELIRHDPGVKLVEHDSYGEPIIEHESGESFERTPPTPVRKAKRWTKTSHRGYHWWSVQICAGKKLDLPIPPKGDYVRESKRTLNSSNDVTDIELGVPR